MPHERTLRERLPAGAREHWDRIASLEQSIRTAFAADRTAALPGLAEEREACIAGFCAALPVTLESAELRAEALADLLDRNNALLADGGAEREAAARIASATARQHRAIDAYHAQDDAG